MHGPRRLAQSGGVAGVCNRQRQGFARPEAWRVMGAASEDLSTELWEEVADLLGCDAVRSCKTRQPWVRVGRERAGVLRSLAPWPPLPLPYGVMRAAPAPCRNAPGP